MTRSGSAASTILPHRRLLLGLGRGRHRQVVERNVAGIEAVRRMVRHDRGDVHVELADPPPVEQVDEAMVELRHEDDDLRPLGCRAQPDGHAEADAQRLDPGAHRRLARGIEREGDAHEEARGFGVVILARFEDVAAAAEDVVGDRGDDARLVGAGEGQDEGRAHAAATRSARMRASSAVKVRTLVQ